MINDIVWKFRINVLSIDEVEDSHSSTVYKCNLLNGNTFFIKIPYTKLKFERELEAYRILKGKIAIPKLLDYWTGDERCPGAFLLSALKGQPLTTEATPKLAYHVGVTHAKLHAVEISNEGLTTIQNVFLDWSNFLDTMFYSFAKDVKEVLAEHLYYQSIEKYEHMKRRLPPPDGPCFIHMDFRPGNIIVDGENVSGIIDFESVRFGSTEIDFTKLFRDFLSFDTELFQAYKEGYYSVRSLVDLDLILPFYRFTDAFNSIGWCKRRGLEKNASFYEKNLVLLKKFLLES